jgi:DnaJ-class molecular chaperone
MKRRKDFTPSEAAITATCKRCSGLGEVAMIRGKVGVAMMLRECPSCSGTGEAVYRRGLSLVPLIPRRR